MSSTYYNLNQSKNLGFIERYAIQCGIINKHSVSSIAKELGVSRQTIHNETKRGTTEILDTFLEKHTVYDSYLGQIKHDQCKHLKGRLSKIDDDANLMNYIIQRLEAKDSPEVIEWRLKNEFTFSTSVSARTIYNWVYNGTLGVPVNILPYAKKKRLKRFKREKSRIKPNGGQSIESRMDLSNRLEFGHWEIDCVVGTRNGKSTSLMTLVERKTRFGIVLKIPRKNKKSIVNALKKIKAKYGKYFYDIFKSITADNGSEFKDAIGMSLKLKRGKKVKIYFAHAYCSFERGSNENFNRMIRRWFPKGTSFCNISQEEIDKVTSWINEYPRKQFDFMCSNSLFIKESSKIVDTQK